MRIKIVMDVDEEKHILWRTSPGLQAEESLQISKLLLALSFGCLEVRRL